MTLTTTVRNLNLKKTFVLVGHIALTHGPGEFITILGSCVSVCLWDRKNMTGGMNHYLVPETVNKANSLQGGIESTRQLIKSMLCTSGVKNLEAAVFGGANRFFKEESFLHVGRQNVEAARIVLAEAGIRIAQQDTGGEAGRKIYFNTCTGRIRMIKITYDQPEPALDRLIA